MQIFGVSRSEPGLSETLRKSDMSKINRILVTFGSFTPKQEVPVPSLKIQTKWTKTDKTP